MSSFCLVFAVPDDAPALLNIYSPYVRTTAVSFECEPPTEREFAGRIASIGAFYPYLAAREGGRNGAIVGYAYASRAQERAAYRWNAELSVYLEQGRGGRGAGTALYRALLGLLALQNIRIVLRYGHPAQCGQPASARKVRLPSRGRISPCGIQVGALARCFAPGKSFGRSGGTSGPGTRHTRAGARRRGGRAERRSRPLRS